MKIQFLGAARQVTGSQFYVESDGAKLLVDCGMFQERQFVGRNWNPSPIRAATLDAILLTHAHVDHCGLAPKLVQEGFRKPIYTTDASADLVELILRDSAEIQAEDAAYKRKRHRKEGRKGRYPEKPLYTEHDVDRTLPLLRPVRYQQPVELGKNVTAVFHDAGHILGSAIIELRLRSNGEARRVLFSGDLGQWDKPIVRDPTVFRQADYVVMESTYGDREHQQQGDVETQIAEIVGATAEAGGKIVVPIFAIERAQEVIYHLGRLIAAERIPPIPVFLDSPMAIDATEIFRGHRECFDDEVRAMIDRGELPFRYPGLVMVHSREQSKGLNGLNGPAVIMATSGMCTAGRIKHHLSQYISRPECTVMFVGYQAAGTLGRQILDGNPQVRIHGRQRTVAARVAQIHGLSGHADRSALLRWLGHFEEPPRKLMLVHGEEDEALNLSRHLRHEMGWDVIVPEYQQVVELQ